MFDSVMGVLQSSATALRIALELLGWSTLMFGSLALLVKGSEAWQALRRAATELRVNLALYFLDALFVAPVLAIMTTLIRLGVDSYSLALTDAGFWAWLGTPATFVLAVFLGDFVSYWRHRMEHTRLLWPTHAIHHSDTEMTWLTLSRFHPLNRLVTTAVDVGLLALVGFPDWALVGNVILRHYYGEFIHADLPWMYGPLRAVFVSPVMHRWHHARDVTGAGSNFATVFSVFDRTFGTYYVPGLCTVPLGVTDDMGKGTVGQLLYPFVAWTDAFRRRTNKRDSPEHPQPDSV